MQQGNLPLIAPLDRDKMLGELYDQLPAAKDLGEARPIMDSIEELWRSSGSDTVDLLLSRSERFIKDTDLDLAAEILDATIDLAPETAEAWHKRATVEFLRKDYESALADLRRSLSLDPRNYRAMNDLGIMLEAVGPEEGRARGLSQGAQGEPVPRRGARRGQGIDPRGRGSGHLAMRVIPAKAGIQPIDSYN